MNVNGTFELSGGQLADALGRLRRLGVTVARADAFWESAEPRAPEGSRHSYDWFVNDLRAQALARARLRWLVAVEYSTRWSTSVPGSDKGAPEDPADYAAYAGALAERYGPHGSFWRAHQDLPYLPVREYQIWNEPNTRGFWQPRPDPEAYARLYAEARRAIKRVDPEATVIMAGLAARPRYDPEGYLRRVLAALPEDTDVDAVAFHPYGESPQVAIERLDRFVAALDAAGLGRVPLHLTELGWPTRGIESVPEPTRAAYMKTLLGHVRRLGCRIRQVIPHTWVTPRLDSRDREDWYGLLEDGRLSPAAEAYGEFVSLGEPASGCSGKPSAPSG